MRGLVDRALPEAHALGVIASVAFRNFRALRQASLRLGAFNLLIGPAGSGKTSLIEALLRLRACADTPPAEGPPPAGAATELAFRFQSPLDGFDVRLADERLWLVAGDSAGWPVLQAAIAGIRACAFDPAAMSAPSRLESGSELAADGANLAAVIAQLRERHPAAFTALEAQALRVFPEYAGIELHPRADGTVTFAFALRGGEAPVESRSLSQGTLHTMAVLTLAFAPQRPTVLCIEEADRGVHPRMLREIRDALYRLSHPEASGLDLPAVQVIATTHSPYLLDLFRDHPEDIVLTRKHGAEAGFERLSDRADLPELLAEGSLGDLWFSGLLGGVPEAE